MRRRGGKNVHVLSSQLTPGMPQTSLSSPGDNKVTAHLPVLKLFPT